MPDTCCACQSGRKGSDYSGSYHAIPNGEKRAILRESWLKAIPFEGWTPPKTAKLCDRHFSADDFVLERRDSNTSRHLARGGSMKHKFLRDDAVPHIWPECPKYLSKISPPRRNDSSSAESRRLKETIAKQRELDLAKENDAVPTFQELQKKLPTIGLPGDVISRIDIDGNLIFVSLCSAPYPKVKFSLTILSFTLVDDVIVRPTKVLPVATTKIQYASDISTLLSFLKNYSGDKTIENSVDTACALIKYIGEEDKGREYSTKLSFILEQLQLVFQNPTGRRYCPATIATCMMWYKTSRALYKMILSNNVLTIPCVAHMNRLSSALTVDLEFSGSTIAYLKARMTCLSERDKNISVLMDEVKSDQSVEYIGGGFSGRTENGVTKGLLGIMIASLAGGYHDMVAMLPVVTLTSIFMGDMFDKVLKGLTQLGFSVCAISVDGHRTNKKFYKDLCAAGGPATSIAPSVKNPYHTKDLIHILFDTTHIFKCIYNIFLTRGTFKCPAFMDFEEMSPDFSHIKMVHNLEFGKSPKIAYKLNDKNLNSRPIERCNVGLAEAIFHSSTIAALIAYSDRFPFFKTTAKFLQTIQKWLGHVH